MPKRDKFDSRSPGTFELFENAKANSYEPCPMCGGVHGDASVSDGHSTAETIAILLGWIREDSESAFLALWMAATGRTSRREASIALRCSRGKVGILARRARERMASGDRILGFTSPAAIAQQDRRGARQGTLSPPGGVRRSGSFEVSRECEKN
jgi:hypothetical protein